MYHGGGGGRGGYGGGGGRGGGGLPRYIGAPHGGGPPSHPPPGGGKGGKDGKGKVMDEEELLEQNLMRIARGNARTLADTCRANEVTGGPPPW